MEDPGVSADVSVVNEKGLHTRTSTVFVKAATQFKSEIRVSTDHQEVDGKSVMSLLTLSAKKGTRLKIACAGPDQVEALNRLKSMIENGFPGIEDEGSSHH